MFVQSSNTHAVFVHETLNRCPRALPAHLKKYEGASAEGGGRVFIFFIRGESGFP